MMRRILFVCSILALTTCSDDRQWEYPTTFPVVVMEPTEASTGFGNVFTAKVITSGAQPIVRYGFCWLRAIDKSRDPEPDVDLTQDATSLSNGSFSVEVFSDLTWHTKGEVRAFIKTEDKVIYSNSVPFDGGLFKDAEIIEVAPIKAVPATEVSIHGKYFSRVVSRYRIELGGVQCNVISASDTTIKFTVPAVPKGSAQLIVIMGESTIGKYSFEVL
jgi:hypothetical protein